MSTTSLPSYTAPLLGRTPSYTAEPQAYEQRLALNRLRARPSSEFTKQSKSGGIALRFLGQEENAAYPVYGVSDVIEGIVDISKTDGVHSVDVKVSHPWPVFSKWWLTFDRRNPLRSRVCCASRRLQRAEQ